MTINITTQKQQEWWQEGAGFFGRKYMEGDDSYEGFLSTPLKLEERTHIEVNGLITLLDLHTPQRVLDCPCGYGRHSIEMARRGVQVVGVDINSEELLAACQAGCVLPTLLFLQEDMRALTFHQEFDAVINMFYSFGFFETDEENLRVLQNFYHALRPGGKFLLHTDVNLPRILNGHYKFAEERRLSSGRMLRLVDSYDPIRKRINGCWTLVDSAGREEELTPYSVRVYSFEEFADWCKGCGFQKVSGYGSWKGEPMSDESEEMIIVAEK